VLSKIDFEMLSREHGASFVDQLARRLEEAVAMGRDALVLGPEILVRALVPRISGNANITARSDTSYAGYMRSLMGAEYAFFWNYLSFSLLHRVVANGPVFFFGAGHLDHILPRMAQEGIRMFYAGWSPPLLPLDAPLAETDLARREVEVRREFRRIEEGMRLCPAPRELLRTAMAGVTRA
jgi:hypothetical protein